MTSSTGYYFFDTNVFMHFKPFDEVMWTDYFPSDEVYIVVAPVTLRELDRHKDRHRSRGMRKRVGGVMRKLHRLVEGGSPSRVRDGVQLVALVDEPSVDFAAHGLRPEVDDDWLIASMIEHAASCSACVYLVADDVGPKLKAEHRSFSVIELPSTLRLNPPRDEEEKELLQLRREVARLEGGLPKPKLTFQDGEPVLEVTIGPEVTFTDRDRFYTHAVLEKQHPDLPVMPPPRTTVQGKTFDVPDPFWEQASEHNRGLSSWRERMLDWQAETSRLEERKALTVELPLVLSNDGTSPAEDVTAVVEFPELVVAHADLSALRTPSAPEKPEKPSMFGGGSLDALRGFMAAEEVRLAGLGPTRAEPEPGLEWKLDGRTAWCDVGRVKQSTTVTLPLLYLEFRSRQTSTSFGFQFRLIPANLPDAVEGELHVRLDGVKGVAGA